MVCTQTEENRRLDSVLEASCEDRHVAADVEGGQSAGSQPRCEPHRETKRRDPVTPEDQAARHVGSMDMQGCDVYGVHRWFISVPCLCHTY